MARTFSTFLMFDGEAEAAMTSYVSLFAGARIVSVARYGAGDGPPHMEGRVKLARFTLGTHELMCIDSPVTHAFGFTPAISIFVECESAEELEHAFAALSDGGQALMPLGDYGFSTRFGWVNDRFGVSWQLNLV